LDVNGVSSAVVTVVLIVSFSNGNDTAILSLLIAAGLNRNNPAALKPPIA
jgi:hypothetical protein